MLSSGNPALEHPNGLTSQGFCYMSRQEKSFQEEMGSLCVFESLWADVFLWRQQGFLKCEVKVTGSCGCFKNTHTS